MTDLFPQALAWVRSQIVPTKPFIYLNFGYTGPSPRSVGAAVRAWMRASYEKGLTTPQAVEEQHRVTEGVRRKVARLLGCAPEEVALRDNTSQGVTLVAGGLDWREGDEVVTNEQEHPSGLLPWFLLLERWGVRVKVVYLPPGANPLQELAKTITSRTRLVCCISHVLYCIGMLVPRNIYKFGYRRLSFMRALVVKKCQ